MPETSSPTKTSKSQATKSRILFVAKQVFANKGFNHTTIKDITQAAGLGYGTFYLYFKDKKEVFYALVEQVEDELYSAADGGADLEQDYPRGVSSYRALRNDLKALLESFQHNGSIIKFSQELSLTDAEFSLHYQKMRAKLIGRTKQILEKSGLSGVNLDIAAIALAGMIESSANELINPQSSLLNNTKYNIDEILPTLTKLYFKAVS